MFAVSGRFRRSSRLCSAGRWPGRQRRPKWQSYGVNANQVFKWVRPFDRGELSEPSVALVPVTVGSPRDESRDTEEAPRAAAGAIHIELWSGDDSARSGADSSLVRSILESLRQ